VYTLSLRNNTVKVHLQQFNVNYLTMCPPKKKKLHIYVQCDQSIHVTLIFNFQFPASY